MKEVDSEVLTYIGRLEEQRQKVGDNVNLLREEKMQRDTVYALQKQISDTMHVLSEEREQYLKIWRDNDMLKIAKSKQERKLADLVGICNNQTGEYVVEDKFQATKKFMGTQSDFTNKVPNKQTKPRPTSSHVCKIHPQDATNNNRSQGNPNSGSALGYYTRHIGNLVEKPRNIIRTVYLPNQETLDMNSEIDKLKDENETQRKQYEERIKYMREEKRQREEEYFQVHNKDSQQIDLCNQQLAETEENIFDTNKDILTLLYEFGQRERDYVEELEDVKRKNIVLKNKLHGMVKNTVDQTDVFSKHSELQTEDLANKFRVQQMRFSEEATIVKDQTKFLKKIMGERLSELESKLNTYQVKFNNLSKRRVLDLEGFVSDTMAVQKQTRNIEDKIRRKNLTVNKEKENILDDVMRLKNEIKDFQNQIHNQNDLIEE